MCEEQEVKCYLDGEEVLLVDIHNHIEELVIKYKQLAMKSYFSLGKGDNV